MSFEVDGQVFESQEDYEKNYVVHKMDDESIYGKDDSQIKRKRQLSKQQPTNLLEGKQLRWAMEGALRAAFLVYGSVAVGVLIFIAFCVFVWFR